jgi:hypothetical protein
MSESGKAQNAGATKPEGSQEVDAHTSSSLVLSSSSLRTLVEQWRALAAYVDPDTLQGVPPLVQRALRKCADELAALLSPVEGRQQTDVRGIIEALGFDPTNHHNAAKCPYCTPKAVEGRQGEEHEDDQAKHCEICAPQEKRLQGYRCSVHNEKGGLAVVRATNDGQV